jgi:hypothetical protein
MTNKWVKSLKEDVTSFMLGRSKDDCYYTFINWEKSPLELVGVTMYAPEEIKLPRKYDVIFQIDKPSNFEVVPVIITQAIFNGWMPIDYLEKGHKHVCVMRFSNQIPRIFNSAATFKDGRQSDGIEIGLCDVDEFLIINGNQLHP